MYTLNCSQCQLCHVFLASFWSILDSLVEICCSRILLTFHHSSYFCITVNCLLPLLDDDTPPYETVFRSTHHVSSSSPLFRTIITIHFNLISFPSITLLFQICWYPVFLLYPSSPL